MKKLISVFAIAVFTINFAQETPKKACCSGKDAKECKMDSKKTAKSCPDKNHKDCKIDHSNTKKVTKKAA